MDILPLPPPPPPTTTTTTTEGASRHTSWEWGQNDFFLGGKTRKNVPKKENPFCKSTSSFFFVCLFEKKSKKIESFSEKSKKKVEKGYEKKIGKIDIYVHAVLAKSTRPTLIFLPSFFEAASLLQYLMKKKDAVRW